MREARAGLSERARAVLLSGLLAVLGLLGNILSAPLYLGVDFLFGSIAVLLATALCGTALGTLVALVASSYTLALWGHPYAAIIFTGEALFVGALLGRGRYNLVLLDGLFWLAVGMPAVWGTYHHLLDISSSSTLLIMLKQAVNGISNAVIASLILSFLPGASWHRRFQDTVPLHHHLFNVFAVLTLVPALVLTVAGGHRQQAQIEETVRSRFGVLSASLLSRIQAREQRALGAIAALAGAARRAGVARSPALDRAARLVREAFPDFHNVYVADAQGRTVAFYPPVNVEGKSTIGLDFSDRPYFMKLRDLKKPVISDVFSGRGGVFEPIVTVSVPVLREGRFEGYALGALDLEGLGEALRDYTVETTLEATILDRAGQVITSTNPDFLPGTHVQPERVGESRKVEGDMVHFIPEASGRPTMERWAGSFFLQRRESGLGDWSLVLKAPILPFRESLVSGYINGLSLALGMIVVTLLLAQMLARLMARPLARLAAATSALPRRLLDDEAVDWSRSRVSELARLSDNFQEMHVALREKFLQLGAANKALKETTAKLEQHNEALQSEVRERQRAEAELQVSEIRFRTVVEQSPFAIQLFSPDGRIIQANRAWEDLWQIRVDEVRDTYDIRRDPQLREQGLDEQVERAFAGQAVAVPAFWYDPTRLGAIGQGRWIEVFLYPLLGSEGGVREVVLMLRDVTERKRADEERARILAREREARAEAERLYRQADRAARRKDEFLAMLAHELRTPLAAVGSASQVLRKTRPPDPRHERALQILDRQVTHQVRLIDDLLDVSRISRGKLQLQRERVDLVSVARSVTEDVEPILARAGLKLHRDLPDEPVMLYGDVTRLAQALTNLLQNAQKFTPAGGEIFLTLVREGDRAWLEVRDTGIGITPAMLSEVFDPFVQGKREVEQGTGGLGLGLAMVRGLVALHGGEVTAESEGEGRGATFRIVLPLVDAPEPDARPGRDARPGERSLRLLLVEDSPDAAEVLADLLELTGHEVTVASTGEQAIETARTGSFDAVICDIGLPDMTGMDVARRLRADARTRHLVLLSLSGYGRPDDYRAALEAGFQQHLVKPVDFDALLAVLHETTG